jgi:hypothetical protein
MSAFEPGGSGASNAHSNSSLDDLPNRIQLIVFNLPLLQLAQPFAASPPSNAVELEDI